MTESQGYRNLFMDHPCTSESSRLGIRIANTDQPVDPKSSQDSNKLSLLDNAKADGALNSSWIQRLKPHIMSSNEIPKRQNHVWTHFSKDFSSSHKRKDKALNIARSSSWPCEVQCDTKVTNAKDDVIKCKPDRILRVPSDEGTHTSDSSWKTGNLSRHQNDFGRPASIEALVPSVHNTEVSSIEKHRDTHNLLKNNKKATCGHDCNGLCSMQVSDSVDNFIRSQSPAQIASDAETKHGVLRMKSPVNVDHVRLTESGNNAASPSQASNGSVRKKGAVGMTMSNSMPVKFDHDDVLSIFVGNAAEKIVNQNKINAGSKESRCDLPPKPASNFGFLLIDGRSKTCTNQPSKADPSFSVHTTDGRSKICMKQPSKPHPSTSVHRTSNNIPRSFIVKDMSNSVGNTHTVPFNKTNNWDQKVKTDGKHSVAVVSKSNIPRSCIQPELVDDWIITKELKQQEHVIHTGTWQTNCLLPNSLQEYNVKEHHGRLDHPSTEVKSIGECSPENMFLYNLSMKPCLFPLEKEITALQNFDRREEKVICSGTSTGACVQDETSQQTELEKFEASTNGDGMTKSSNNQQAWIQRWRPSRNMCLKSQMNLPDFPHGKNNTIPLNIGNQCTEDSVAQKHAKSKNYVPFPAYRPRPFPREKYVSPSAEALSIVGTMASKVQATLRNGESFIDSSHDTHNLRNAFNHEKTVSDERLGAWMCMDEAYFET